MLNRLKRLNEELEKLLKESEQELEISETVCYNESDEFDYNRVIRNLQRKQKKKKPVNIKDNQENATFKNSIGVFTEAELNNGVAVRFTSKYEYSLEVYSDSTYTIIHRKRLK